MKIYIASSWSNRTAVELMTLLLRNMGHAVVSFIEDGDNRNLDNIPFHQWYKTDDAKEAFTHDSHGAMNSDIVIYIGPSGKDAMCECGMAYAKGKHLIALWAKKEDLGLMHKIFNRIFDHYEDLFEEVKRYGNPKTKQ